HMQVSYRRFLRRRPHGSPGKLKDGENSPAVGNLASSSPARRGAGSRAGRNGILGETPQHSVTRSEALQSVSKNGRGKRWVGWPAARACHREDEPMLYEVRTYTLRPGEPWPNLKSVLPSGCPCGRNTPNWGPSGTLSLGRSIKSSTSIPMTTC